jgi:hypothetical protein
MQSSEDGIEVAVHLSAMAVHLSAIGSSAPYLLAAGPATVVSLVHRRFATSYKGSNAKRKQS